MNSRQKVGDTGSCLTLVRSMLAPCSSLETVCEFPPEDAAPASVVELGARLSARRPPLKNSATPTRSFRVALFMVPFLVGVTGK